MQQKRTARNDGIAFIWCGCGLGYRILQGLLSPVGIHLDFPTADTLDPDDDNDSIPDDFEVLPVFWTD
jgi:hypothetical protein